MYGFQTTGHTCDAPSELGIYDNCDEYGQCILSFLTNDIEYDYGPGAEYLIDTTQAFHVQIEFHDGGNIFTGYTMTLSQNEYSVSVSTTNCAYLKALTSHI